LVTGSTHNIGLAIARAFAREGAKVIVHSRHEDDAKRVASEISGDFFAADVADPKQTAAMFDHIRTQHRRLDILVNSVAHSDKGGVLDVTLEEWNRILTVNLTGYFLFIQHAGKIMKAQGSGNIINISAGSGERSSPGGAAYSVSKGAINALTRQAAADLAPMVRVNGLISGLVGTPIGSKDMGIVSRNTISFRCAGSAGLKRSPKLPSFWLPIKRATSRTRFCRWMGGV
jgi:NAD(P)-dependent dehydrogenase (short-subunit alcohol dehydrogenase family)